jgi:hypothetical protein
LLAACGGSGTSSEAVASAAITNVITGRYAAYFNQLAPELRASTTRETFVECMAKAAGGNAGAKASVVGTERARYTKADGTIITADSVTMHIQVRSIDSNVVVWIVAGKVAAIDPKTDPACVKPL